MNPFFSVIIPLYNKEAYIKQTLESVLKQSFTNFEIIIVNDGSTDCSVSIVDGFEDSRIKLFHQNNQGPSVARHKGISLAKAAFIALLDADDTWAENHLTELKKSIDLLPEAILYCNNYEIKRKHNVVTPACFNFTYDKEPLIIEDFFKANVINYIPSSSSTTFRKEDYYKIDGYRTELRSGQDIDLWVQFALKGDIAFNPTITMTYSFYDNLSLSNSDYNANRFQFIYSYIEEEKENPSLKYYLDVNRYALILRYRLLGGHKDIIKTLMNDIDGRNLNIKQKITMHLPKTILMQLKKFQNFLLKQNLYLTAYK